MARFCICWLACCSLLLPCPARAESPISAEFFLQSIEPAPSASMLYDFLDIYGKSFAECKETDTYLRALGYLEANGDTRTVRDRLKRLAACPGLSDAERQRLAALQTKVAEPRPSVVERMPLQKLATAVPPKPVAETPAPAPMPVPPKPLTEAVAPRSVVETAVPTPVPAPIQETQGTPVPSPAVTPEPTPDPAPVPVAEPLAATPPATLPATPSTPPVISEVEPVIPSAQVVITPPVASVTAAPPDIAAATAKPAATTPKSEPARPPKAKKASVRRTSLPVTPTIPMPSRTVPPQVLAPSGIPAQPALPDAPQGKPQITSEPTPVAAPAWRTEVASRTVYRTGTEGTSRLLRLENTATLGYGDWSFSATALYLNAGTAGSREFAGSYFRGTPQRSLLTEQAAFIPQIAYDSDTIDFSIGTSPLGGEVSPLPTFRLSYSFENLKLAVFQESVTDSLLSYTGFRDPVTGQRMGRVMRAGARIGWDGTFAEHWFYGGALTGAYLYGENVKDNAQVRGEFYIGRSLGEVLGGNVSVGSYSAIDHYSTNLNNYTFGHGGYYSPYIAATSMLFFSWEYAGEAGRLKADISSGFLYEKTRDTSQYYWVDGLDVPDGVYEGETHRRITVNAGLEGSLNLTDSLTLNASARVINSGDFTEARGGLYLKWTF